MKPPAAPVPPPLLERIRREATEAENPLPNASFGARPEDRYKVISRFDGLGAYLDLQRPDEPLQYTQSGMVVGVRHYDNGALTVSVGTRHLKQGEATNEPVLRDIATLFGGVVAAAADNGLPAKFVHEGRDIALPPGVDAGTVPGLTGRSQENVWAAWLAQEHGAEQVSWEPDTGAFIASLREQGFSEDDVMAYLGGRQFRQAVTTEDSEAYMQEHVVERFAPFFTKAYTYDSMLRAYAVRAHDHVRPLRYMARLATELTTLDNHLHYVQHPIIDVARAHNLDRHHHHLAVLQSEGPSANLFDLSGLPHPHRLGHDAFFDAPPFTSAVTQLFGSVALSSCLRQK